MLIDTHQCDQGALARDYTSQSVEGECSNPLLSSWGPNPPWFNSLVHGRRSTQHLTRQACVESEQK